MWELTVEQSGWGDLFHIANISAESKFVFTAKTHAEALKIPAIVGRTLDAASGGRGGVGKIVERRLMALVPPKEAFTQ